MAKPRYQHVRPDPDAHDEAARPDPTRPSYCGAKVGFGATCGLKIKQVDENEGPESLKALLRF